MDFDPYREWLSITSQNRPINHFELLGLSPIEDNVDVITEAYESRTNKVRKFQAGHHSDDALRILDELAEAYVYLTNEEKRKTYVESLRKNTPVESIQAPNDCSHELPRQLPANATPQSEPNFPNFDPYFKWLAIPPEEQPPNHYRLLGLPVFADDPDVIENAADQRMAHIRNYQAGKHSEFSQRILNELAQARVCLLNGEKKSQYDAHLNAQLQYAAQMQQAAMAQQQAVPVAAVVPQAQAVAPMLPADQISAAAPVYAEQPQQPTEPLFQTKNESAASITRRRAKKAQLTMIVGGLIGLLLIVGVAFFLTRSNDDSDNGNGTANNVDDNDSDSNDTNDDNDATDDSNSSTNSSDNEPSDSTLSNAPADDPPPFSIQLDGRDYISFQNTQSLLNISKAFTVETWARWQVTDKELALFGSWGQLIDKNRSGWGIALGPPVKPGQKGNQLYLRCRNHAGAFFYYYKPLGQTKLDEWHHFAICNDTEFFNFFINGEMKFRFPTKDIAKSDGTAEHFSIGSDPQQLGNGMSSGEIRGFRISSGVRYESSFTPPQILKHDTTTLQSLDFSQPSGVSILDLSPFARRGQLVGAKWLDQSSQLVEIEYSPNPIDGVSWAGSDKSVFEKSDIGWTQTIGDKSYDFFEVDRTAEHVELATVVGNRRLRLSNGRASLWDSKQMQWTAYATGTWGDSPMVTTDVPNTNTPIDLLAKIDYANHTQYGQSSYDGRTTTITEATDVAQVIIPFTPPAEYEVEAHITRTTGVNGFTIVLIIGGRQCRLTLDASQQSGYFTGLEGIESDPNAHKGGVLTNGQQAIVKCRVSPSKCELTIDGEKVYQWEGNASDLRLTGRKTPSTDTMAIATYKSEFRISKLVLTPIDSGASPLNPTTVAKIDKLPAPSIFDRTEGKRQVETLMADDLAKATDAESKTELASRMIEFGQNQSEENGTRFVLLEEARRLAIEALNLSLAIDAIDVQNRYFEEVDVWTLKNAALAEIKSKVKSLSERTKLAEAAVMMSDGAFSKGRIDISIEVLKLATSAAAPPAGNSAIRKAIAARKQLVVGIMPQWQSAKVALDQLKVDSANAAANSAWGKFVCFIQRDWDEGLVFLSRGSDQAMKSAAQQDLARPTLANHQIDVADAWWDIAAGLSDRSQESAKLRARVWYERAAPFTTTPLVKNKIDQRLAETEDLVTPPMTDEANAQDAPSDLPYDLPASQAGLVGRMTINGNDTGAMFRYSPGSQILSSQIDELVRRSRASRPRIEIVLRGTIHVPVKTNVTLRHNGGDSYLTNDIQIEDLGVASSVGGKQRDANGSYKRTDVQTFELKKGDHEIQWTLRGRYGRVGISCDFQFTDESGEAMKIYHTRKTLSAVRGRAKKVPEIRLGG